MPKIYRNINNNLWSVLARHFHNIHYVSMNDNVPVHRANSVKECIANNKKITTIIMTCWVSWASYYWEHLVTNKKKPVPSKLTQNSSSWLKFGLGKYTFLLHWRPVCDYTWKACWSCKDERQFDKDWGKMGIYYLSNRY